MRERVSQARARRRLDVLRGLEHCVDPALVGVARCAALAHARRPRARHDAVRAWPAAAAATRTKDGPVGAGGRELPTPFGTFYAPNITPDRDTGIGAWSDDEIVAAIRAGETRSRRRRGAGDAVLSATPAWRTPTCATWSPTCAPCPPAARQPRRHEVTLPLPRLAYRAWRWLFAPAVSAAGRRRRASRWRAAAISSTTSRSAATATRRATASGRLERRLYLAGAKRRPGRRPGAQHHPRPARPGIGKWSEQNIVAAAAAAACSPTSTTCRG